jgi:hypothetical protein
VLEDQDLGQLRLDVRPLLLQARLVGFQHRQEALELGALVAPGLVHVDQLADFRQREPEPLAAQGELEAGAIARGVDPARAGAPGSEQAVVLVEADRARRDVELARQLADGKLGAFLFALQHDRVRRF